MISPTMISLTTTSLMNWLSPSVMHSLGWALLHFLWQGTAVAALAAVLMSFCRRASTRYALGVGALVLMLAAPIATFFLLTPGLAAPAKFSPTTETQPTVISNIVVGTSSKFSNISSLDTLPWLVEAWLFGVAFFSLRSAGGFLLIERERRNRSITPSNRVLAMCQTVQRQLGLDRTIRYCKCLWLRHRPSLAGFVRSFCCR
jgi:hypothetical protein